MIAATKKINFIFTCDAAFYMRCCMTRNGFSTHPHPKIKVFYWPEAEAGLVNISYYGMHIWYLWENGTWRAWANPTEGNRKKQQKNIFLLFIFLWNCLLVRTVDTVMCHSRLAQPCYLLKGGHCLGLIFRLEMRALSVGFPMDLVSRVCWAQKYGCNFRQM